MSGGGGDDDADAVGAGGTGGGVDLKGLVLAGGEVAGAVGDEGGAGVGVDEGEGLVGGVGVEGGLVEADAVGLAVGELEVEGDGAGGGELGGDAVVVVELSLEGVGVLGGVGDDVEAGAGDAGGDEGVGVLGDGAGGAVDDGAPGAIGADPGAAGGLSTLVRWLRRLRMALLTLSRPAVVTRGEPAEEGLSRAGMWSVPLRRAVLSSIMEASGLAAFMRAMAPATMGEAIEVPDS